MYEDSFTRAESQAKAVSPAPADVSPTSSSPPKEIKGAAMRQMLSGNAWMRSPR